MASEPRDPFEEDPEPQFVEVDVVSLEAAWEGEGDAHVLCPGCDTPPKGHYAERGTAASNDRDWVSFSPCGHVVVLADWAVY
jgi:hypothetical protein